MCPGTDDGERWDDAIELSRDGRIDDVAPQMQIQYVRSLERIEERWMFSARLHTLAECRNIWMCGPADCGKSSFVHKFFSEDDVYKKIQNKHWCNYKQQPVVFIEDVDETGFG